MRSRRTSRSPAPPARLQNHHPSKSSFRTRSLDCPTASRPVVLCCLEGLSYDLAAHAWASPNRPCAAGSIGLASSSHHGYVAVESRRAPFGSALEPIRLMLPPLSSSLVESTVQFSIRWTSVTGLLSGAAVIPDSIAGLAQGVIKTMLLNSLKLSGIGALLVAGVLGTVVVAQQGKNDGGDGGPQTTQ